MGTSPSRPRRPPGAISACLVLAALAVFSGCAARAGGGGPFPEFSEHEGKSVRRVTFLGDLRFSQDSLRAVITTRPSRCRILFLPICLPIRNIGREEYRLNLNELARDVGRVQLYHRDHGYYGARVVPSIEPIDDDRVGVEFLVAPGRQALLRELSVEGAEEIISDEELLALMPLKVGEPFGRLDFLASADTVRYELLRRGHAYADVLRNYALDTIMGVAEVEFVALPGPLVFVDTILFQGNERLSERALRRQLTFPEGQILRQEELARSQRNLYNLDMVNFAAVRLAPDTLQVDAEQQQATVLVQVVEAAQYAVEMSAGFGTVECIRTTGRWVNRNFIGGGRRLEINGSLSRIGVGRPADLGFERSRLCTSVGGESFLGIPGFTFEDKVDYRLAANFQQPSIFGTQNQLAVDVHLERISEISAYIRESVGSRISAVRQIQAGPTLLTTTFDVERGRTLASPVVLCVGFDTCTEEDLDRLRRSRWSNSLSLSLVRDRTITDGTSSRGHLLRGTTDWSSAVIGSDDRYLRVLVEGIAYRPLRPGWTLAGNLRYGRFLSGVLGAESGYIPPERRFYAGGPNSVRGYARNGLGPTAFIQLTNELGGETIGSATGGTQMIVGSVELRTPSPFMSDVLRLAAFLDAGQVSAPGAELLSSGGIRFTPGAGLRFITPVGPFRLDVAFNPYRADPGPLYRVDPDLGLVLDDPDHRSEAPSFLQKFRVQFGLGQAF